MSVICHHTNNRKGLGSSAFKTTEYGLVSNDRYFLIHYIGDETAFEDMPHGNAKKSGKNDVRTTMSAIYAIITMSTIYAIKEGLETGQTAGKVHNKLKSTVDGQAAGSRAPHNLKQH